MRSIVMVSIVACLAALFLSGCGSLKKDLEKAKSTIKELTSKNLDLNGELTKLKAEHAKLSQVVSRLEEENKRLKSETEDLKKDISKRSDKADQYKKKHKELRKELSKLKSENQELTKELRTLKERARDPLASTSKPSAVAAATGLAQPTQKTELNMPRDLAPCDAVVAFIRAASAIAKDYKGAQRTKLMADLKAKYSSKLSEAPPAAQKAADTYTKEIKKAWDGTDEDSIFRGAKVQKRSPKGLWKIA